MESSSNTSTVGVGVTTMNIWQENNPRSPLIKASFSHTRNRDSRFNPSASGNGAGTPATLSTRKPHCSNSNRNVLNVYKRVCVRSRWADVQRFPANQGQVAVTLPDRIISRLEWALATCCPFAGLAMGLLLASASSHATDGAGFQFSQVGLQKIHSSTPSTEQRAQARSR